jgi:hypothetical protein
MGLVMDATRNWEAAIVRGNRVSPESTVKRWRDLESFGLTSPAALGGEWTESARF